VASFTPRLTEAGRVADRHLGNVLHEYRHTVRLKKRNVLDILDLESLRQIGGAAAVDEADPANIDGLLADIDRAAAHIDIGVADGGDHLGQRNTVGIKLVQIDLDIVLLGRATPGV